MPTDNRSILWDSLDAAEPPLFGTNKDRTPEQREARAQVSSDTHQLPRVTRPQYGAASLTTDLLTFARAQANRDNVEAQERMQQHWAEEADRMARRSELSRKRQLVFATTSVLAAICTALLLFGIHQYATAGGGGGSVNPAVALLPPPGVPRPNVSQQLLLAAAACAYVSPAAAKMEQPLVARNSSLLSLHGGCGQVVYQYDWNASTAQDKVNSYSNARLSAEYSGAGAYIIEKYCHVSHPQPTHGTD